MSAGATTDDDRQVVDLQTAATLTAVRAGGHTTFDRAVFEFAGSRPGHDVRYVPQVLQDGSGLPVPLRGRAFLQATLSPATAHTDNGAPTSGPLPSVAGLAALRQIADAGDFEAVLTFGIGVADRTPFQVRLFTAPPRIAIDIAHTPPGTGNRLLRRGDRSAAVATWQWRLHLALGRQLDVDEIFGPATEAATRDFQQQQGLGVDGIVGPRSRAAMERVLGI
jgi:peptidoglycan hydrolase-like protein with peptidoglycan-binding domain